MIKNLAYAGFTSPAADEWRTFGPEILGASPADDGPDGEIRLRIDDKAWRIAVHPGDADDVAYLGWSVAADGLDDLLARVVASGLDVTEDASLAERRRVDRLAWFVDPFGFRHELVGELDDGVAFEPARELEGSFVTGDQGFGHIVLIVPDLEAADAFLVDVMGMRISDYIVDNGLDLRFYHCATSTARHHTVALSAVPGMVGMHHIMLEVTEPDDVGRALDLAKNAGRPIAMDLGRHPNDLMTSFYVRTPSGFELEYGSGGVVVDDAKWETTTYDAMSIWGHRPPSDGPLFPSVLRPVEVGS